MADEAWTSPTFRFPERQPQPGEALWTVQRDGRRVACELRDHGEEFGVEVQLLRDVEFYAGRRFDNRIQAVQYADLIRGDLERKGWRLDGTDA